jgi:hypothetical protein
LIYELIPDCGKWRAEILYHHNAEKLPLRGCHQGEVCDTWKIAGILGGTKEQQKRIQGECDQYQQAKYGHLKKASHVTPTEEEKSQFLQQTLRRCNSCLSAVPSKATTCFFCWGTFLVKETQTSKETQ